MSGKFTVRPARISDCLEIARLYRISSDGVAVNQSWRGAGIGSRLMSLAEDSARSRGLEKLSLLVFDQNSGAKSLYDRLG